MFNHNALVGCCDHWLLNLCDLTLNLGFVRGNRSLQYVPNLELDGRVLLLDLFLDLALAVVLGGLGGPSVLSIDSESGGLLRALQTCGSS